MPPGPNFPREKDLLYIVLGLKCGEGGMVMAGTYFTPSAPSAAITSLGASAE